jgi:hypothetical protein
MILVGVRNIKGYSVYFRPARKPLLMKEHNLQYKTLVHTIVDAVVIFEI